MSPVDNAIRAAVGVTVVGLAGIAGAISYSHMTELAYVHSETGWRAHMFPLSVDGIEIVASLVLLADKRAGRHSGRLPWAALIAGTGASFAANIAVGGSDWIGRAVSGWPAFALLIAIKLLFGLLDHPTGHGVVEAPAAPVLTPAADRPDRPGTAPALPGTVPIQPEGSPTHADATASVPDDGDDNANGKDRSGGADAPAEDASDKSLPAVSTALDVAELAPAARDARVTLARTGKPLTREALARQMHADGHAASNARVSALLKVLAAEPIEPQDGDAEKAA
ncbi:DUF2637 domain-containing protein [Dactylosporangium matsuzakiense]|uniref:DUF2637 domain-containing protein n=1 Tax=Dactylosporangium matsuzakiense TaxID=53360 RepID=A0A9W6KSP8_9ACTN|nr:DUF2637 domain-containing protein [Dactylosporangium matsuzakiense]GLL06908.1 hypothetical protein GCM10017581_086580 [Dactylosporangium matsuzakiense]